MRKEKERGKEGREKGGRAEEIASAKAHRLWRQRGLWGFCLDVVQEAGAWSLSGEQIGDLLVVHFGFDD